MKIKEIIYEAAPTAATVDSPADDVAPTAKEIADIQALLGTIDPVKEQPQTLLGKLTGWIKQYPILDKVTDILPQTRLIKAIALAVDAIEGGDSKGALNALAGAVGGGVAKAAQAVNVGTALAQGDVNQAALAAGGTVGNIAKAANVTQNLAQNNLQGAAQAAGGGVAKAANAMGKVQNYMATAQPTAVTTAQAPDELARVKQLANV